MENAPRNTVNTPEVDSKSTESTKKTSKKKAESFGALLVEKDPPKQPEKASFFRLKQEKADDNPSEKPVEKATSEAAPEAAELPKDLGELNTEEQRYAVLALNEALEEQAAAENPETEEDKQAAEEAAEYRQAVRDAEGDLDTADKLMQERGHELPDTEPETETETELVKNAEEPVSDAPEAEQHTAEQDEAAEADVENDTEQTPENEADDTEDEALAANPTSTYAANQTHNSANTTPPSNGSGNNPPSPPMPPTPPYVPGGTPPNPPMPPAHAGPIFAAMPNAAHQAPALRPNVIVDRGNQGGVFLLGGIVGYLVGRRRGRIKTEKRLMPIQKKLEKNVESLQIQLQTKEAKIREAAREKVRTQKLHAKEPLNTVQDTKPSKSEALTAAPSPFAEVIAAHERPKPISETTRVVEAIAKTPERTPIVAKPEAPTHLGKMIVTAEAVAPAKPSAEAVTAAEKPKLKQELTAEQHKSIEKTVLTMNRAELFETAESVIVDGSSLRQIYETKLVSERGLRRLVEVHLRGGNVKKQLQREIVEREIDFERDPILRDKVRVDQALNGGGTAASLQSMLQKTGADTTQKQDEVAFLRARAEHQEKEQVREQQKRRMLDVSLATIIVMLFGFILILMMERM